MSRNKRMIYIWDENLEYYDSLQNKSDVINNILQNLVVDAEGSTLDVIAEKLRKIDERNS